MTQAARIEPAKIETLRELASLANASRQNTAPPAQHPSPGTSNFGGGTAPVPPNPSPEPGPSRPMTRNELGPLQMDRYLDHFGIAYDVKDEGSRTLYRLEKCLFNPDHGPNEASIVVPRQGPIHYQCFHASCKGKRTWKDARAVISGDQKLTEFRTGYDPNWVPPRQTGTGMMADLPIPMTDAVSLKNGIGGGPKVPQPADVDPREFYEMKRNRPVFVPYYLAKYLAAYLHPVCATNGVFYHYEGGLWKEFTKTSIAQICVHAMREEIQAAWIEAVQKILAGMVNREETEWPDHPTMINVKNGMFDMEKQELLPHDPVWGSRTQLPVSYRPELGYPKQWPEFLQDIFFDDEDYSKRMLLQQFFGYCLLRDARYQRALFMYGTGSNGKSTVLDVLTAMVGAENTSSLTLQDLSKQFRAQFLQNKLVNLSTETDTRDPLTTSTFKQVVDGSLITTEEKYGRPFQFRPFAKWIVAMNEAPVIPDKSYGLSRRVLVLNFNRRLLPEEIKEKLAESLIAEIDQIFYWALDGLHHLLKFGFEIGAQVKEDTDKMMEILNPMLIFVSECCEVYDEAHESSTRMWNAYSAWCAEGKNRPLGRNKFYEQLMATFTRVKKGRKMEGSVQEMRFTGIHLTSAGREYAEKGERKSNKLFE